MNLLTQSYPLSPMQEGILFHSLLDNESGMYVEQITADLQEKIDISLLEKSWQKIIQRHPILTTSFSWQDKQPYQTFNQKAQFIFNVVDWQDFSFETQEDKLREYLNQDRKKGFDLSQPPLSRVALFRRAENHHTMIWTFHHILLDGRSFILILKELFTIYESLSQNKSIELTNISPYHNYINWLRQQDLEPAKIFWQKQLQDFTAPTYLPIQANKINTKERLIKEYKLSTELTSNLYELTQINQITLNTICQGVWSLLLSRYSGENDIIFGAIRACRHTVKNAESMVGLLINTVPIRLKIEPHQSVILFLQYLRKLWLELRNYEYTPLSKIKQWNKINTNIDLFNSLIHFENYELNQELQSQGGSWKKRKFKLLERGNYPLAVGFYGGEKLTIKISCDRTLFAEDTVNRMFGHLQTLFTGIVNNPQEKIYRLPILTETEKKQILVDWNQTQVEYPQDKCLHQLFEEQVLKTPDNIAVVYKNQKITYHQLNEKANKLAHYLVKIGVKNQSKIGICVEKSLEMIIGIIAILKTGNAYVPMDSNYPSERLNLMILQSEISILLTQKKLQLETKKGNYTTINLDEDWGLIEKENSDNLINLAFPHDLAYIIYTSGSTGQPKGVMIEHTSAVNIIWWRLHQLESQDLENFAVTASISFDLSVIQIFPSLMVGGKIIIVEDLSHFAVVSQQEKITYFSAPPSILERYITDYQLSENIEAIGLGAEKVTPELIEKLTKIPHIKRIYNSYGPTETTVGATSNLVFHRS